MAARKNRSSPPSSLLAPGFRFHPTDEELVRYYLRRKVCGKGFGIDAISDIDIYKAEPWDLPGFSRLKTRDLEWYFFTILDKKYVNGAKTNRATEKGYWKTTGKDRAVYHRSQIVGMKKTLVFHIGRAPKGQRSNWVMHEYRLADLELERAGIVQDAFVLCRVFQKSGSGPKNGEQYGAPFVEEEWEDDDLESILKAEMVDFRDDVYLDGKDLEQILRSDVPSKASLPLESANDTSKKLQSTDISNQFCEPKLQEDGNPYLWGPYEMDARDVKHEYIGESSKTPDDSDDLDYLLDEPFVDAPDGLFYANGGFFEANDLSKPVETNTSSLDMLEENLTHFDANENTKQIEFDPSLILGSEELDDGFDRKGHIDSGEYKSDVEYPHGKKASHMMSCSPASSAFGAEFPSKDVVLRLDSLSQPSSSVHVTAGMIRIMNLNTDGNWLMGKQENFSVDISFGFLEGGGLESSLSVSEGKAAMSWFYFVLFWVVVLSVSFKLGTCVSAK